MKIINIYKPKGCTSFEVVYFLKKKFKEKKVGHLGTLDPIATGVLPVFLGKATKLIPLFNNLDKTYRAVCKLGESTDTFDSEGLVIKKNNPIRLNFENVSEKLLTFSGKQKQSVPPFSASKFNGTPFYKLARQGLKVPEKIKNVIFHELVIEKFEAPYIQYIVRCSKGTYIRSMANDLGNLLGVGAHLTSLERLACGDLFNTKNSITIERLKNIEKSEKIPWIQPKNLLGELYTIKADKKMLSYVKFGRKVELAKLNSLISNKNEDEKVNIQKTNPYKIKVLDINQNLIAIGHLLWENESWYFQPSKVFI